MITSIRAMGQARAFRDCVQSVTPIDRGTYAYRVRACPSENPAMLLSHCAAYDDGESR